MWSTQLKIKAISLETTQTQIRISLRENEITAVSTIIKEKHVTMSVTLSVLRIFVHSFTCHFSEWRTAFFCEIPMSIS